MQLIPRNIRQRARLSAAVFYLLALIAVSFWVYGIVRRIRLWRQGRARRHERRLAIGSSTAGSRCVAAARVWGRGAASVAHVLLFSGFVVLLIGTTLIAIEHLLADLFGREPGNPVFHKGVYFGVYEIVMDTFGMRFSSGASCSLCGAGAVAGVTHAAQRISEFSFALIAIGVTGYVVES